MKENRNLTGGCVSSLEKCHVQTFKTTWGQSKWVTLTSHVSTVTLQKGQTACALSRAVLKKKKKTLLVFSLQVRAVTQELQLWWKVIPQTATRRTRCSAQRTVKRYQVVFVWYVHSMIMHRCITEGLRVQPSFISSSLSLALVPHAPARLIVSYCWCETSRERFRTETYNTAGASSIFSTLRRVHLIS